MSLIISQGEHKPQEAIWTFAYILDSFNKFSKVLTNELPNALPPCKEVNHKTKMVPSLIPPTKAPYRLNQKELKEPRK
jgi:hypothetical protein